MLVISHRGYHVNLPENTLQSFEAALAIGVDGIETDIRLSADNVAVLMHDHLAPDGREVAALTHTEICQAVGYAVPTLEQTLQFVLKCDSKLLWNLEIKVPAAVNQTIALVERFRADRRILITSFCHPVVDEVSRRTDVDCGVIVAHGPIAFDSRPDWLPSRPNLNTVVWYYETVDAELIARSAACGLHNYVYGVTTPDEHARISKWALEGVITDRPDFVRQVSNLSE